MSAALITAALGGRKSGSGWTARCPAHDDRTPSLSINEGDDGKALVHCHAGCDQEQVIAALRSRNLWPENAPRPFKPVAPHRTAFTHKAKHDEAERMAAALSIWASSTPASRTLVEAYLASRGLFLSLPETLRFHPGLKHPSGGVWPAMVALVTGGANNRPVAIHRTFLTRDGGGKAPVDPQKMMLGVCHGGAVRLAEINPTLPLVLAEGIETAAAVMVATGFPSWAALSAPGLAALRLPTLPAVPDIIIAADHDINGTGRRHALVVAERFLAEGRRVRIALPPQKNTDFNDMLIGCDTSVTGGASDVAA